MKVKITPRITKKHYSSHYQTSNFDYWCVAPHPSPWEPKYLEEYGGCHTYEIDNTCNEYCNICAKEWRCPIPFCNQEDHWDEETGEWT